MVDAKRQDRFDVFISYAHEDLARVASDIEWLKSQGHAVWFDGNIHAGSQWADELADAIDACRFVLFFASARSIRSTHCMNEIAYATDAGKRIVPVYLEQVELGGGLKLTLSRAQAVLRWQLSHDDYLRRLGQACTLQRESTEDLQTSARPRGEPIWLVPAVQNRSFSGRQGLIDDLGEHLRTDSPPIVAITGLAGVGKSQIALEYAHRHRREYDLVAWLRAETAAALEADLVALAGALKLDQADDPSTEVVLNAVKRYLGGRAGCLLIFDNSAGTIDLNRYLPTNLDAHVILTSRQQRWGRYARNLPIDAFTLEEARDFLLRRAHINGTDPTDKLIETLGRLPLALEEAAAYIETTGRSATSFLELFENHHQILLDSHDVGDYPTSFRAALEVSLTQLEAEDETATDVLKLFAFTAADDIPVELLLKGEIKTSWRVPIEIAIDRAVSILSKYSLLRMVEGAASVHRLVQIVCRDRMSEEDQRAYAQRVLLRVEEAFPPVRQMGEQSTLCRRLLPHAIELFDYFDDDASPPKGIGILMARAGTFLSASSWSNSAMEMLERAYRIFLNDPDSKPTLGYTCELYGRASYKLGQLDHARSLFHQALDVYEGSKPVKHKRTLQIYVGLAWLAWSQGDYPRAEEYAERSLDALRKAFRKRDPRRMAASSILARIYTDAGRPADAREAVDDAIRAIDSVRGYRMPLMCGVFMQVADVLLSLGDFGRAQKWAREAVALGGPALSESHPLISTSHCVLGQILLHLGELELARVEFERATEAAQEANCPLNQHQFVAFWFLVRTLIALGDVERAAQVADAQPDDASDRIAGNSAFAEGQALLVQAQLACRAADFDRAGVLGAAGDAKLREHYGPVHGYRLDSLLLLGDIHRESGRPAEARECYAEGLRIGRQLELDGHPSLAGQLLGQAALDEAEGNSEAAAAARAQASELLGRIPGLSSRHVLLNR